MPEPKKSKSPSLMMSARVIYYFSYSLKEGRAFQAFIYLLLRSGSHFLSEGLEFYGREEEEGVLELDFVCALFPPSPRGGEERRKIGI